MAEKSKYWTAVGYPENMVDNWRDQIGDLLQVPFAYCVHDKCLDKDGDERKLHVHIVIAFNNTTTYNHALKVFRRLGETAFNKCEMVISIRHMYNYLIHNTEDCRKKGKHQYDPAERITGNNFDIGSLEQLSQKEKDDMFIELTGLVIAEQITNYGDFVQKVMYEYGGEYMTIVKGNSGHFDRLIRGVYHKITEPELRAIRRAEIQRARNEGFLSD